MEELIIENENLIYHTLKKLKMYHLLDEYYDVGMIGLVKASKNYTEEKGKFSTYAVACISNEIKQEFRKQSAGKRKGETISLSKKIYDDITLEETISSEECIEDELIRKEQFEIMYKLLNDLEDSERELIKKYYGVGEARMTQEEIAKFNKVSQAEVSRKINSIIKKLKEKAQK